MFPEDFGPERRPGQRPSPALRESSRFVAFSHFTPCTFQVVTKSCVVKKNSIGANRPPFVFAFDIETKTRNNPSL
jgi:hypothetical protein